MHTYNLHGSKLNNLKVIDVYSFYGLTKYCPE
jgi:hypothetical protein